MKLLYVAPLNSIHARRWVSHFAGNGHEVSVVDTAGSEDHGLDGVRVESLVWEGSASIGTRLFGYRTRLKRLVDGLRRSIDSVQPDVVHLHWMAGPHALALAQTGFRPIIATPWGSDLLVQARRFTLRGHSVKRIIAASDRFCCDAEHLKAELVARGAAPESVDVIYFGTDTRLFSPTARDAGLATELGFTPGTPLVVSNRALKPIYNVETLIRAVPATLKSVPQARFVIVGGGDELQMLKNLAEELGVARKVAFVGRLSDEDMVRYTASATVYVSTSLSDGGLAASTAEAMACEVPVTISDFGENGAWIETDAAGRLFPLRDHGTLAAHLVELLSDASVRGRLGKRGREIILERNDRYREMARVESLYQSLAGMK